MAETAWVKLLTRPENLEVIRLVDVLLWNEVLNCSDYFLHAVDMLFCTVKRNNRFMGGVLMIGTGTPGISLMSKTLKRHKRQTATQRGKSSLLGKNRYNLVVFIFDSIMQPLEFYLRR